MDKLQMCRICLAENVDMCVVVNKELRQVYEKLSNVPFVTEDSRPILACDICCAQLKKCYRFQKKCLEAEEQFTKMMNEEYEQKPLINQDQFELFHGFIRTPIDVISIVDVDQTENIVVKEELPAVCEGHDDIRSIIEKEEHLSDDDQEAVNYRFTVQNNCLNIEYVAPRNFKSDSEDDVPLTDVKTEVKRKAELTSDVSVLKKPRLEDEITAQQSETDPEMTEPKQVNSDEKPYKCDTSFTQNIMIKDLTKHMQVNSDEKPYKCDYIELLKPPTVNTMVSLIKRGIPLEGQSREIVFNVYQHFLREANIFKNNMDDDISCYFKKIQARVASATGVSRRTLTKILNEVNQSPLSSFLFITPQKGRPKKLYY